ncbi:endothelin-converting enzyme 1-like [Dendronephthya gigantea]|uniref:endothelin-converting enzyme 1-like n=1 Tax=Dendronephthya gigantea TaxID=151771 RepID=UPI00106C310E|nr:endothelin-converting enzyme 1-like [Dendronephthya gigantea]XP_028391097.1 endothelin-converting enzyme 1-like [Dendronephthya gigantea]
MPDEKNTSFPSRKTKLEKILLASVAVLCATIGFLVYLYLMQTQEACENTAGDHTNKSPEICTDSNCVVNAANLMKNMDPTVDPCDDFYSYACGKYDKTTPIPAHLDSIHVLRQLQEANTEVLKSIIEDSKVRSQYAKNPSVSKLFQAYDMCLTHGKFDDKALSTFREFIKRLGNSNITSNEWDEKNYDVFDAMVIGTRLKMHFFFTTEVWINPKNSSEHVFAIFEPRLALNTILDLPKKTTKKELIRQSYREHMISLLRWVSTNPSEVPRAVDEILRLERRIAKILTRFNSKEESTFTIAEFSKFTKFEWLSFLQNLTSGIEHRPTEDDILLVVRCKYILKHIIRVIKTTEKRIISNFIAWKVLQESIPALPSMLGELTKKFQNDIRDRPVEKQRWQTCIEMLSESFKKVLSYLYVERKFSEDSRNKAFQIFAEIRREFVDSLKNETWMDERTKMAAAEKARAINFLVGYSDETNRIQEINTAFEKLKVNKTNFFETFLNQRRFGVEKDLRKLLHPVNENSFDKLTSHANAYYSRYENKISFLAGILQRPIYDSRNSRASNYGSLGMIVGHELTHAFDIRGHKYDKNGNLRDWWSPLSLKNFKEKTTCFTEQYNKFTLLGESIRGFKTLGENIADNGGLKLAFNAFKRDEKKNSKDLKLPGLNLTNDQVFFLSFAQVWCSKYTKHWIQNSIDNRVPMMFRVTGPLCNSVEFSKAYRCPVGSQMNPVRKCALW